MLYPVEIFEISRAIVQVTPEMLGATEIEILSTSTVKRLVIEQGRYLKREERVGSCKFQRNYKLQVFVSKLPVVNCELNLELQFSKKIAESTFETASC